jgi:hypothetical protein
MFQGVTGGELSFGQKRTVLNADLRSTLSKDNAEAEHLSANADWFIRIGGREANQNSEAARTKGLCT